MVARVTTAQRFSFSLSAVQRTQARIQDIQEEIVTGKRIQGASDDPAAFSRILNIRRLIGDSNQFIRNIQSTQALVNVTDTSLQSIRDLVVQARTLAVEQAGAPSDSATRAAAAVQVNSIRESILDFANTQVGGRYIFAGTNIFSPAYNDNGQYQGDQGKLDINVAINDSNPINVVGSDFLSTDLDPDLFVTSGLAKSSTTVTDNFVINGSNNVVVFQEQPSGTSTQVTVTSGSYTGATLAAELQTRMNASAMAGDYQVSYNGETDSFSVNLTTTSGTPNGFQVLTPGTDAASTGAAVFGFTVDSSLAISSTSNSKVAFNVIAGVNDAFSIRLNGGTNTAITVDAGVYSGEELAAQVQLKINNNVKEVTTANQSIKILEDGGIRSETFNLTTGTKTGAALASELQTALNASTTLTGSTAAGGAGYVVAYNTAADKFVITTGSPAVSVGVETGTSDLGALMGFTSKSPFGASVTSDINFTGATVDFNSSFKDRFAVTSTTAGTNSSIALTSGANDFLAGLNMDNATVVASKSTLLSDLNGGEGVDAGAISITNRAGQEFTVDISAISTLQQVFDSIEAAVTGVKASISSDGKRIILTDTNSPIVSNLIVKEIGVNTTAADLGILANTPGNITGRDIDPSLSSDTPISTLRDGAGVKLGKVNMGGDNIDLNIGSKVTVSDLIVTLNTDPNGTASISNDGKHLQLAATDPNGSVLLTDVDGTIARDLGIQGGGNLLGLLETLEKALLSNDPSTIERTLDEFDISLDRIGEQQVKTGEVSRQFDRVATQHEDLILSLAEVLTKEEDVDLTQALTEFSVLQTTLQAALGSTAQIIQISLLDFLS